MNQNISSGARRLRVPGRSDALGEAERAELVALREGLASLSAVCDELRNGDLEARVGPLPDHPLLERVRWSINHFADLADAFVRESGATLAAAGEGRFHRRFLAQGMVGAFRGGAGDIDRARAKLKNDAEELALQRSDRLELGARIAEVSMHVASAATELSATADSLASSAQAAVDDSSGVLGDVEGLETSAEQIKDAADSIHAIAKQTRLLALNTTIEASRAGDAGAGFKVVASEVKALADHSTSVSERISGLAHSSQQHTQAALSSLRRIIEAIQSMEVQIKGIAAAAGDGGDATGPGLATMSQTLRRETVVLTEG